MKSICRHCNDPERAVNRPRGLCWNCYYAPGVRENYASTSKFASRGVSDSHAKGKRLADRPTDAEPGSPEKAAVLQQRAADGVSLWHPKDAGNEMSVHSPDRNLPVRLLGAKLQTRDRVTFHKQRFGG